MLTFNVKKEWFEKIKSGEKTHEYREVKDYWTYRIVKDLFFFRCEKVKKWRLDRFKQLFFITFKEFGNGVGVRWYTKIQFMNGMLPEKTKPRIFAKLKSIKIVDGLNTDLKIDKPVYDIEFDLIKEQK